MKKIILIIFLIINISSLFCQDGIKRKLYNIADSTVYDTITVNDTVTWYSDTATWYSDTATWYSDTAAYSDTTSFMQLDTLYLCDIGTNDSLFCSRYIINKSEDSEGGLENPLIYVDWKKTLFLCITADIEDTLIVDTNLCTRLNPDSIKYIYYGEFNSSYLNCNVLYNSSEYFVTYKDAITRKSLLIIFLNP